NALDAFTAAIKQATPVAIGNATDAATGRSYYGDLDNAKAAGQKATTLADKLAQFDALVGFKADIAAAKAGTTAPAATTDTKTTTTKVGAKFAAFAKAVKAAFQNLTK
ncbi:hypothetical protein, partial [Lacticaseibacillus parakribbianus]